MYRYAYRIAVALGVGLSLCVSSAMASEYSEFKQKKCDDKTLYAVREKYVQDCIRMLNIQPGAEATAYDCVRNAGKYYARECSLRTRRANLDRITGMEQDWIEKRKREYDQRIFGLQLRMGSYTSVYYDVWSHISTFLWGGKSSDGVIRYDALTAALCSRQVRITRTIPGVFPTCLALRPDGKKLLVGWSDAYVSKFNLTSGNTVHYGDVHRECGGDDPITGLAWSQNEGLEWEWAGTSGNPSGIMFYCNPQGTLLIAPSAVSDLQAQGIETEAGSNYAPVAYTCSTNGRYFSVDHQGNLQVLMQNDTVETINHPVGINPQTGVVVGDSIPHIAVNKNGTVYILANRQGNRLYVGRERPNGQFTEMALIDHSTGSGSLPIGVSINDAGTLACSVARGQVAVIKIASSDLSQTTLIPPSGKQFHDVSVAPTGMRIACCTNDGMIYCYDSESQQCISQIQPQCGQYYERLRRRYGPDVHDSVKLFGDGTCFITYKKGNIKSVCCYNLSHYDGAMQLSPPSFNICSGLLGAQKMVQAMRDVNPKRNQLICNLSEQDSQAFCALKSGENTTVLIRNFLTHLNGLKLVLKSSQLPLSSSSPSSFSSACTSMMQSS